MVALILINFAWNQAPIVGWAVAYIIAMLVLGVLLVGAFFYYEIKLAPKPLIPFDALSKDVGFILVAVACGWSCFGIWYYYIQQVVLVVQNGSPLLAAAKTSPVAISGPLAAFTTMLLLPRLGPGLVMFLALAAFTIGTILIATMPSEQIYWAQMFVSACITPWGMDMSFPAATLILSNSVQKEHQGIAASLVLTVVNYSISLGLGFAGTIEVNVNNGGLSNANILAGYRGAFYFGIGTAGLGMVVSALFWATSRRPHDPLARIEGDEK